MSKMYPCLQIERKQTKLALIYYKLKVALYFLRMKSIDNLKSNLAEFIF